MVDKFIYDNWKKQIRDRINRPRGTGTVARPLIANLKGMGRRGTISPLKPPEIK